MKPYPKNIYQTAALIQKYKDAGLVITDDPKVETALNEIGCRRSRTDTLPPITLGFLGTLFTQPSIML